MRKSFLLFCFMLMYVGTSAWGIPLPSCAGEGMEKIQNDTVLFRFVPGKRMFWADYRGNRQSIERLQTVIREHKDAIFSGSEKVRVLGFCSSYGSVKENLAVAKNRSNQVKSYYIVHEGLKEEHFYTTNSASAWNGDSEIVAIAFMVESAQVEDSLENRDAVESGVADGEAGVETPAGPEDDIKPSVPDEDAENSVADNVQPAASVENMASVAREENMTPAAGETIREASVEESMESVAERTRHHRFAIKTNVAYLAATVANIGVEYSFGEHYSIDVPFIFSPYRVSRNYTLKFMAVQPEFRYWLKTPMEGHFFGVHASAGAFNVAVNSDLRYQSPNGFYGVGVSYGYMLPFAKRWAAEFTVGAGYVYTEYDSYYNIDNGARYRKGVSYNYWGLTRVGVGLVYKFGK